MFLWFHNDRKISGEFLKVKLEDRHHFHVECISNGFETFEYFRKKLQVLNEKELNTNVQNHAPWLENTSK